MSQLNVYIANWMVQSGYYQLRLIHFVYNVIIYLMNEMKNINLFFME